jgi:hypothetical protein
MRAKVIHKFKCGHGLPKFLRYALNLFFRLHQQMLYFFTRIFCCSFQPSTCEYTFLWTTTEACAEKGYCATKQLECSILNSIHRRGELARASRKWTWLGSDVARQPIKSLFSLFARTNPPNRKQALTVAETAKTKHFTLISKFLFQHRLETNWRLEILWWNPNWVRIGLEWPEKGVSFP